MSSSSPVHQQTQHGRSSGEKNATPSSSAGVTTPQAPSTPPAGTTTTPPVTTAPPPQKRTPSQQATNRLQKELMDLMDLSGSYDASESAASSPGTSGADSLCLISAFPAGDDLFNWLATIRGPTGSAYEGLEYQLQLKFPADYPFSPPEVEFLTLCFHPNVLLRVPGPICLDVLKEGWSAVMSVQSVLISLQSLLADPNPRSPLNAEAATLLLNANNEEYRRRVLSCHGSK